MAIAVVIVLALVLAYYALQPLRRDGERLAPAPDLAEEMRARKRQALEGIIDIESERDAGKLSDTDFAALRADYEMQAVAALRALERAESTDPRLDLPEPDDELEAEIAALRAELLCPACGAARPRSAVCPRCGYS